MDFAGIQYRKALVSHFLSPDKHPEPRGSGCLYIAVAMGDNSMRDWSSAGGSIVLFQTSFGIFPDACNNPCTFIVMDNLNR